jgi:hypothetical protein
MDTFVGKFLVRRTKTTEGKDVFVLCGAAFPDNFPLASIKDNDEIWCVRLGVLEIAKYEHKNPGSNGYHGGIEQFIVESPALTGNFSEWKKKV